MAELTRGGFLPPVQYRGRPDPVQNRVKDVKSLFIIGELFGNIISPLTFKLIAGEVSAAT